MQSDSGKLFIGGISWDTNEECLREYFSKFGEVVEAVIMRDRNTGRARGFGFVVFTDPTVAQRVIKEKHNIDGRMVEAKKAVPRDDQNILNRSVNSSMQGSRGPSRTRKIFVGGLASSVTDSDFRKHFEQFGTITDVVVMYDQNTQRPRGFGFITYDSEEAVGKALFKNFHELNGKMVEVKRAVPKELSPIPSRSPVGGFNYGMGRINTLLNGYNPGAIGGYGLRMDGRFSSVAAARSGFAPFGSGYGMDMNFESGLTATGYGVTANFANNVGHARTLSPYYLSNTNRLGAAVGLEGSNGGNTSFFSLVTRNLWGNGGLSYNTGTANYGPYSGPGNANAPGESINNSGLNWGRSSVISGHGVGNNTPINTVNLRYGNGDNSVAFTRNNGTSIIPVSSYSITNGSEIGGYDATALTDFYSGGSAYGSPTWRSPALEKEGVSESFCYGLDDAASDDPNRSSPGYINGYNFNRRLSTRGIAT